MRKLAIVLAVWLMMAVGIGAIGCSEKTSPTPTPEPTIPVNFTTYTNNAGIFSISYPQDWEAPLWMLENLELYSTDYMNSVNSSQSVSDVYVLFLAGQPMDGGLDPNINIVVEPRPAGTVTLDSVIDAEILGLESTATDFHELSRTEMTVGGREAAIIEYEASFEAAEVHNLVMFIPTEVNVWTTTCTTGPEKYSSAENTLYDILRSFIIYK